MPDGAGPPATSTEGSPTRDGVVVPLRPGHRRAAAGTLGAPGALGAFGKLGQPVHMAKGPLGFPDHRDFVLADVPDPILAEFKLLRSVEDDGPVLIVTPLPDCVRPIADEDLAEIADAIGVPIDEALFLLVVTLRPKPDGDGMAMSVNLRAPIVFDPASGRARQCVIGNGRYRVQHPFFGWSGSSAARGGR